MDKKILIINTGGTISSVKTQDGYAPQKGFVAKALSHIPELAHADMPEYDLIEIEPLIDSSNITVDDWNALGDLIARHYEDYDGFVIFHGTDTMAYTASSLSFMLEGLAKPVILTGSQIPLSEVRNDATQNIIGSLWIAAHYELAEVCVYFDSRLLRGNRTQKVSAHQFKAFDSPNFPPLARLGIAVEFKTHLLRAPVKEAFHNAALSPHFIANFRLFPGFSSRVLHHLLQQPLRGLVLESYGIGNAQNNDEQFLDTLSDACARGIVIVNCSQCHQARVDMDSYSTGRSLQAAGLISGYDMTPEAAHAKLLYLFSKGYSTEEIKAAMEHSLRGELMGN